MGCVESVVVSGCRGNVLECTGRSKLWNASVLECNLENTLEITFGTFQVLHFLEYPYFLIGTRFGTPLFRNAPGNPTGRSKIWNAPIFGTPLFSTLKSDWILAGICLDILERPFSDFGMSRNHFRGTAGLQESI
mgnify:CR=1 FL=1